MNDLNQENNKNNYKGSVVQIAANSCADIRSTAQISALVTSGNEPFGVIKHRRLMISQHKFRESRIQSRMGAERR